VNDVKYPDINVTLVGRDGNAFNLIGIVARELRRAKVPADKIKRFQEEAMSGDYDNVLITCMCWVNVN